MPTREPDSCPAPGRGTAILDVDFVGDKGTVVRMTCSRLRHGYRPHDRYWQVRVQRADLLLLLLIGLVVYAISGNNFANAFKPAASSTCPHCNSAGDVVLLVTRILVSPPSGGDTNPPVDGCGRGVFVVR